jgi:hypothetical protein
MGLGARSLQRNTPFLALNSFQTGEKCGGGVWIRVGQGHGQAGRALLGQAGRLVVPVPRCAPDGTGSRLPPREPVLPCCGGGKRVRMHGRWGRATW